MKRIVLIAALCLGFVGVYAQEVYSSSGHTGYHKKTKKKGYDPDKLIIGGGLNAGFGNGTTEVGISPIVGYRFFNNFSAGIGVGYQYYKFATSDPSSGPQYYISENMVYPNIWSRYFVYQNIYVTGTLEYDFINAKGTALDNYGNSYSENQNVTNVAFLVGGGFKQSLGGRVSGFMEIMYDVIQGENTPYPKQPIMRIGFCAGL